MKENLLAIFLTSACITTATGQSFSGQWKGEFIDKSNKVNGWGGDRCQYVLDLDVKGSQVSGFSYTYYSEDGKNFYTICKLKGVLDKQKKQVEVQEVERTKTNVPESIRNCFQVHRLSYTNESGYEAITGNWYAASKQDGSCGYGLTTLTRRTLAKDYVAYNNPAAKDKAKFSHPSPVPVSAYKAKSASRNTTALKPRSVVEDNASTRAMVRFNNKELVPNTMLIETEALESRPTPHSVKGMEEPSVNWADRYEKRSNSLIQTIHVNEKKIRVDLYDNGEIDGDSISVFYDGKLIVARKRLSDKPITLFLPVTENTCRHELVMYADNLGSIPPNTALMIVTDGDKRHEIRVTSDLKKSGTINFVHKEED
jgi:hypothetical protein